MSTMEENAWQLHKCGKQEAWRSTWNIFDHLLITTRIVLDPQEQVAAGWHHSETLEQK